MTQHLDRRHFLGLAGVTASAAALAACGGPSTSGTPKASEAAELDFSGVKPAANGRVSIDGNWKRSREIWQRPWVTDPWCETASKPMTWATAI